MSLEDIPKKVQHIVIDSQYVNGTNNIFSIDLTLESNIHVEDMSRVLGIKLVDFYVTDIGEDDVEVAASDIIAKYVDIVCPEIPKVAQLLDERHGQLFARIPLERHYSGNASSVVKDKHWRTFNRHQTYFNPISIKKLNFTMYEKRDNGTYTLLQPDSKWYMILEVTTQNIKEKPKDRELQILMALEKLLKKIDRLNQNVERLPEKPPDENPKKYSFGLLVAILVSLLGGFIWWVNKSSA